MKAIWEIYKELAIEQSNFIGEFYADIASTMGPFGKLFLHSLAGLTIMAITICNYAVIASYPLSRSLIDYLAFVLFMIIVDMVVYIKVWGIYKALEQFK